MQTVIKESTVVFKLLPSEDKLWLVRRYVGIDVKGGQGLHEVVHAFIQAYDDEDGGQGGGSTLVDGIGRLDFEGDSLASQGLHEVVHAFIQTYDDKDGGQVEGRQFVDGTKDSTSRTEDR